jgi:light-regulated signal transduction histidine kinase (bacteriophytochrome)
MSPRPHSSELDGEVDGVSELLLRLCHDLRSCLRSIRPHAEMILKSGQSGSPEEFQQRVGFLLDGTTRLDSILGGLAAYAVALQMDATGFRDVGLDSVLRNALMLVEREYSGIRDKLSSAPLPRVMGDPDRLQQVFEILIRNAIERAGESEPRIEISAEQQAKEWIISIRDHAVGVDAADLENMFRPLERWNGRSTRESGFGMATCRVIIERHGGRIWAECDRATCAFRFALPLAGE